MKNEFPNASPDSADLSNSEGSDSPSPSAAVTTPSQLGPTSEPGNLGTRLPVGLEDDVRPGTPTLWEQKSWEQETWEQGQDEPLDAPQRRSRLLEHLPFILFGLTCLTTLQLGGPLYAGGLMVILLFHELGHYLQARRYGVPTSLPFFLPMPAIISPFGTLGAVLSMRPGVAQRKGLFDIAVTGPLAGLVPALIATVLGLSWSEVVPKGDGATVTLGAPLLFQWLAEWLVERPEDHAILLHPLGYAGWVGLLVTALNLFPVGQLDGGHILYTLTPKWAHKVSWAVVLGAWAWMAWQEYWTWSLMLVLLALIGLRHPPVRPGGEPLGWGRKILGWGTLALAVVIFTPKPFDF